MNEQIIKSINTFLKSHQWCDFEIMEIKDDLIIGGRTSFDSKPDFKISFKDVFYIQCLANWKTDTSSDSFFIPELSERRDINIKYGIEEGYILFKILPEDLEGPIYLSAKEVVFEEG